MIEGLNHITLAVTDLDKAFAFYRDLLGFKPLVKWARGAYFLIEETHFWFCLSVDKKRISHECYTHYAFAVDEKNFEKMKTRLLENGVFSFQKNSSSGESFYFLDPDGHKLEIHTGSAQDRLKAKKNDPGSWTHVEWFV